VIVITSQRTYKKTIGRIGTMLKFFRLRRPALVVCASFVCIAVTNTPSKAAYQSYVTIKGQKQGSIKGSSHAGGTGKPNPNGVRLNFHPVITHTQIK
jgi:hypothetical protein